MGCRLTRTLSTELDGEKEKAAFLPASSSTQASSPSANGNGSDRRGPNTNGQSVLLRRDTPQQGLDLKNNGNHANNSLGVPTKPIGEVESASQADFFRMLDDKIAHGKELDSDYDDDDE